MSRSASGVLTLRFHTNQGPAFFSGAMQREIPRALYEIGEDADNRVLVITGTGDTFMNDIERGSLGDLTQPSSWSGIFTRGRSAMQKFVDLEMPLISAVNGPASIHSEWALLADIIVASETATFSDFSHPRVRHSTWRRRGVDLGGSPRLEPLSLPDINWRLFYGGPRQRVGASWPKSSLAIRS